MKETSCEVIRDLLPLYEDGAASEEAQAMVRRHLKDCPDCREELRKLRTPISIPPVGDQEARKRFSEYAAQVQRKEKIKRTCVNGALVLAALFLLWYLWPRSWEDTAGVFEPERVYGTGLWLDPGNIENIYKLDELTADEPAAQEILDILSDHSYRAELRNLFYGTPLGRNGNQTSGSGPVILDFFWGTGPEGGALCATISSNGLVELHGDVRGNYWSDKGLYQEIVDLFLKYGSVE